MFPHEQLGPYITNSTQTQHGRSRTTFNMDPRVPHPHLQYVETRFPRPKLRDETNSMHYSLALQIQTRLHTPSPMFHHIWHPPSNVRKLRQFSTAYSRQSRADPPHPPPLTHLHAVVRHPRCSCLELSRHTPTPRLLLERPHPDLQPHQSQQIPPSRLRSLIMFP